MGSGLGPQSEGLKGFGFKVCRPPGFWPFGLCAVRYVLLNVVLDVSYVCSMVVTNQITNPEKQQF